MKDNLGLDQIPEYITPADRMKNDGSSKVRQNKSFRLMAQIVATMFLQSDLMCRHAYVQVQQTVTFGINGDIVVPAGNFNLVQLRVEGTVTATAGADVGHGIMGCVAQFTFRSDLQGQIGQLTGVEAYYLGLMFGAGVPPIVNSGADGGVSSCSWWIPIWVDIYDTLTINVEWSALAVFHSTATAYSGVMTCVPDFIPDRVTGELRYRHQTLGAAGVVGIGAAISLVPQPVPGFRLFQFMVLQSQTAKGTLADSFANYLLEHNHGIPIGNPLLATHVRDINARETGMLHTAGIDFVKFAPINNDSGTSLTLTNGAAATVDYTTIVYMYISENLAPMVYNKGSDGLTKTWGVSPDLEITTEGNDASPVAPRNRNYIPEGKFGDRGNLRWREYNRDQNDFARFFK